MKASIMTAMLQSNVIAVAACNDKGKRSAYSTKGRNMVLVPSVMVIRSLTPGIWTTDLTARPGYNDGVASKGDLAGNYTNSFGGLQAQLQEPLV